MKNEKTLLFTFDYELFLGKRSGNVLESVVTPTQDILSILDEFNIKAIFFVDTTWLIKLKELSTLYPACKNKLQLISSQLINIVKDGHDVFPHLHPHWMDAVYDSDKDEFNLNNITKYRINQLSKEEREKLFDESIEILKQIIHPDLPSYKINGFRAGGWSIQPFEDFKESFQKHQIIYDFSVMPLVYQFTDAQHFDFSTCIKSSIYRFSNKVEQADDHGPFIEITSDIIYIEPWKKFIDKIYLKFLYKVMHDSTHLKGIGVNSQEVQSKAKSPFGINLTNYNYERVSIELLTRIKLSSYKNFIRNQEFVQFVSHPKILTQHNIKMLKCLLKFAVEHFNINSDFRYFSSTKIKPINHPGDLNSHSHPVTTIGVLSTENMSTISVVIPCYNVATYIKEAIESVIQQTVKCEEIICVDDCSSDNTVAIIKELQSQYPTIIKLIQNDKNEGANHSRNKGLNAATSEFIQFFDADDLLLPTKFEHQLALIEKSDIKIDIVVNSFKKRSLSGVETLYTFESDDAWNSLMRGRLGVTTANLFRRSAILSASGWNENLKSSQEYDLMFRMLKNRANVKIDAAVLNINRERVSGSITQSNPEAKWTRFINLRINIYNYLHENNLLTDKIKITFINEVFNSIRIIYYYNKMVAIDMHRKFIKPIGKPTPTHSNSKKYLFIYNLFGFKLAQIIATILHPQKPY
jgi:glycosyltransferase involved in cell wall biosynthesis/peptidoglycan/xylan/chitin deacetylase (PgdA/CDA1 family)